MGTTPLAAIPYPEALDDPNVPADIQAALLVLEKKLVLTFTTAGARDAVITAPVEGMVVHLTTDNTLTRYDGTGWQIWDMAVQTYTPTLTQSATVTKTVTSARYWRRGKWCDLEVVLTVTGAGTASNEILIGLPPLTPVLTGIPVGVGHVFDNSASQQYLGLATINLTTNFKLMPTTTTGTAAIGALAMTAALGVSDVIRAQLSFEFT